MSAHRQRSRCRCTLLLNAAGKCPGGCPDKTHRQAEHALAARIQARTREAATTIYMHPTAVSDGARKAGATVEKWSDLRFSPRAPKRKTP